MAEKKELKVKPSKTISIEDLEKRGEIEAAGSHVGAYSTDVVRQMIDSAGSHVGAYATLTTHTEFKVEPPAEALKRLKKDKDKK